MKKKIIILTTLFFTFFLAACGCKHEWNNGEITKEATCTDAGVMMYTCSLCSETKTEELPLTEHNWNDGEITKEATCIETGQKTYTCPLCHITKNEELPLTNHNWNSGEITKEATYSAEGETTYTCTICSETKIDPIPIKDEEVIVTVTKKKNLPVDYDKDRYNEEVNLIFKVKNMTDKKIKGVQGTLKIYDLFGEEIMTTSCDFTGKSIAPDKSATYKNMILKINKFIDSETKFYTTDYDDLKFEYSISNVVYSDGSSKESTDEDENTSGSSKKVEVHVTGKKNLPVDYSADRYSPRVEFTFVVKNNTKKQIKGVKGVLDCKDMFGESIIKINCDFTGKTIPSKGKEKYTGLGFDINRFDSDHTKLYSEKYEDLYFEYEVTKIVYK